MGLLGDLVGDLILGTPYGPPTRGLLDEIIMGGIEEYRDRVQDNNYLRGCARIDAQGISETEIIYPTVSLGLADISARRTPQRPTSSWTTQRDNSFRRGRRAARQERRQQRGWII